MTLPRGVERIALLALLLLAAWLRIWDLERLPLGFSDLEMNNLNIIDQVRDGEIRVFYETDTGGKTSAYQSLNALVTLFVGDGMLGYRMLGVWVNLLALSLLYLSTRVLFGRGVALVALAAMTTAIWPVIIARSVTAPTLMPLFIMGTLILMIWAFRLHEPIAPTPPRTLPYTLLGFWVAGAMYVHYSGILLALCVALFILYLWFTEQPVSRRIWSSCLFMVTLILVLGLPYLISILRSPESSDVYILWLDRPRGMSDMGDSILSTFVGLFLDGDADPTRNVPGLPLLWPVWFVFFVVGTVVAIRRWREPVFALLLIILVVGLLPDLWMRGGPDFSALAVAHSVMFILTGLGAYAAAQFVQEHRVVGGWRFVAAVLGIAFILSVWQVYNNLLVEWDERDDVRLAYHSDVGGLAAFVDANPSDEPNLVCTSQLETTEMNDGTIRWSDITRMEYLLHREDLNVRYADCRFAMVFPDGGTMTRLLVVNPRDMAEADAATLRWFEQAKVQSVDGLPADSVLMLDATRGVAELGGQLPVETTLVYPPDRMPVELPVRFGRNITLLGNHRVPPDYAPMDVITVASYWRIDGEIPDQLGVITRLHDSPARQPFSQSTTINLRTDDLRERDVILQVSFMNIPEDIPTGEYLVTLGVYDNNPLNQISVFDRQARQTRGEFLILVPPIRIEEP